MRNPQINRLTAGAAKVEITPTRMGLRLGGHAVNRVAAGVRDPLYARALALSAGDAPLVLVALDLIGLMRGYVEKIRDRVPDLDRRRIWICCTHTHDSPDTIGFWGPMIHEIPLRCGLDGPYMEFLQEQVSGVISKAVRNLKPARLAAASIKTPSNGLSRNVRQEGYKDDEIQVMHLRDSRESTLALAYHYACHPEFLGHYNRMISAEWPGVTSRLLEQKFGGVALCLQNALGGMVTGAVSRDDGAFDPVVGQPFVSQLGCAIADYVELALKKKSRVVEVNVIRTSQADFTLEVANRLFRIAARMKVFPPWMLENDRRSVRTEVNIARLGELTLATVPGEALPAVGFEIKKLLNSPFPWVVNLANDELGYLAPKSYFNDPCYEYECSMSVNPEAAPRIIEELRALMRD